MHFDFSHTNAHARGLFLYVSVIYSVPLPTAIADSVVDMIPKLTKASEACKLTFVEHVPRLKIQPDGKPLIHSRSCDGLKSTEGVL